MSDSMSSKANKGMMRVSIIPKRDQEANEASGRKWNRQIRLAFEQAASTTGHGANCPRGSESALIRADINPRLQSPTHTKFSAFAKTSPALSSFHLHLPPQTSTTTQHQHGLIKFCTAFSSSLIICFSLSFAHYASS